MCIEGILYKNLNAYLKHSDVRLYISMVIVTNTAIQAGTNAMNTPQQRYIRALLKRINPLWARVSGSSLNGSLAWQF